MSQLDFGLLDPYCGKDRMMTHEEVIGRINAVRYGNNINAHERIALSEVVIALRKRAEPEPLAEIVAQYGSDAKGRHYLVFDDSVIRPNIYEYSGDPPMFPVTIYVYERKADEVPPRPEG